MESLRTNPYEDQPAGYSDIVTSLSQKDDPSFRPSSLPVDIPPSNPGTMAGISPSHCAWTEVWDAAREKIFSVHQPLALAVSSPELVSTMLAKHVTYLVKTDPSGYSVRRRYNDFAWLRETLVTKYNGLFIPALPATTKLRGATQHFTGEKVDIHGDFVKNRMSQLHMFAQQLCRIPFIRTDPAFLAFISITNDKEWKSISENVAFLEKHPSFENWKNEGIEVWFNILDDYIINQVDSNRSICEFRRQLDFIIRTLEMIERDARYTGTKAVHFVVASNQLQEQFLAWQKLENDLLDPNSNEYINPHGPRVKQLMTNLALGQLQWSSNMAMIPQIIARVILSSIQYQMVQVEHFLNHMALRENFIKELDRAEKERIKVLEEKNRASAAGQTRKSSVTSMFSKTADDIDDLCQRKTDAVVKLQITVDRMTKAMIFCEMDRFNNDRVKCINQLVGSLSVTNLEIAQASQKKWSDVISNVGIDTSEFTEFVDMLQNTLDLDVELFSEGV